MPKLRLDVFQTENEKIHHLKLYGILNAEGAHDLLKALEPYTKESAQGQILILDFSETHDPDIYGGDVISKIIQIMSKNKVKLISCCLPKIISHFFRLRYFNLKMKNFITFENASKHATKILAP